MNTIGEITGEQSMDELRTLNHSKSKPGLRRSKEHLMLSIHKNRSQASLAPQ